MSANRSGGRCPLIPAASRSNARLAVSESRDWLLIDAVDPIYADRVVANLTGIVGTATGRALLRRLRASRRVTSIIPPEPTDPPNAWTRLREPTAAGSGPDIIVAYDPADWPHPLDPAARAADAVLFALLQDACRQIEGAAASGARARAAEPPDRAPEVARYEGERRDG